RPTQSSRGGALGQATPGRPETCPSRGAPSRPAASSSAGAVPAGPCAKRVVLEEVSNGAIVPSDAGNGAVSACCAPDRARHGHRDAAPNGGAAAHGTLPAEACPPASLPGSARRPAAREGRQDPLALAVSLPGGEFVMGTDEPTFPLDREGPARTVRVDAFAIDRYAVSNRRFAEFVAATGYTTEAERYGWS